MIGDDDGKSAIDGGRRAFLARTGLVLGMSGLGTLIGRAEAAALRDSLEPEQTALRLGFIPLTDCAPLVVARERGHFKRYGLDVSLVREASWANIRDKVAVGALDGAQMLAAIPLAVELGISPVREPMQTSFSLDLNGNGVTVSNVLYAAMQELAPAALAARPVTAAALVPVVAARRAAGLPALRLAMVSRHSRHNYELRYWLAAGGIHPDRDVELIVVPPVHMVAQLEQDAIDGFCVGEPWNSIAVRDDIGRTLISSYEIWNNGPEKVLGVTRRFAEDHPDTLRLILMALLEASQWLDDPANRDEAARLLAAPAYLGLPAEIIALALGGQYRVTPTSAPREIPDFNVFHRYAANYPWRSHAAWFVAQMLRWGQLEESVDVRAVTAAVYRTQPYREAAAMLGLPYPLIDYKVEGRHTRAWTLNAASQPIAMGTDCFLDGREFDADAIVDYLGGFALHGMKVSLAELGAQNA